MPYELEHGMAFFDHLAREPRREAAFQASMAGRSAHEAAAVVEACDLSGVRRLVDVGGGSGLLLRALLEANPRLTGVLFDRPGAVAAVAPIERAETVVEAPLPERALDAPLAIRMDLDMLMLFRDARQRTVAEYRDLLGRAGLALDRMLPTRSPAGLSALEAQPATVATADDRRYGALAT